MTIVKIVALAVWNYLNSPDARKWERALLAGLGTAVVYGLKQAFGW